MAKVRAVWAMGIVGGEVGGGGVVANLEGCGRSAEAVGGGEGGGGLGSESSGQWGQ